MARPVAACPASLHLHHIDRPCTEAVEFLCGTDRRLMGMEAVGFAGRGDIAEVLILSLHRQEHAAAEVLDHVVLSLGAVHRVGWIDLRRPEVHCRGWWVRPRVDLAKR
jgi:hypothetical protein